MPVVNGTAGKDVIHVAGDGTITPPGFTEILIDNTFGDKNAIQAGAGDDVVVAATGGDFVDGGVGIDTILGGDGDDTLLGGDGDDILIGGAGGDFLFGGAGIDTVSYADSPGNGGFRILVSIDGLTGGGDASGDVLGADIENIIGSSFDDSLEGSSAGNLLAGGDGNDSIHGLDGDDTLSGGMGDDALNGGGGADHIDGGDGRDSLTYAGAAGVIVNLSTGTGSGGAAAGDAIINIENVSVLNEADNTLIGSSTDNLLGAFDGNDVLSGLAGNDGLFAGRGDDLMRGGSGADKLSGFEGIDTATYSDSTGGVSVSLGSGTGSGADAAGDTLTDIENLNGSAFGDGLEGSTVANVLRGLAGSDEISGGGGDDTLIGGTGADKLNGGIGIDTATYDDSSAGVVASLAAGTGSGNAAQGDTFSGVENLTGSQGADRLTGDGSANVLRGAGGNDILAGGFGADVLEGGAGTDLVSFFGATLAVDVNLTLGRGAGGDAQGDTYASIENANGGRGGDFITGNAGANGLNGFEGNDRLTGGAGRDMLTGGIGADRFAFITVGDSVVGANADRITDFSRAQGDKIDLSGIDASTALAGNQAFSFIGTQTYHHVAGELRFAVAGGTTTIAGDVNGDGTSDFHIVLTGAIALSAADFML